VTLATALIHGEYWLLLLLWTAILASAWRSAPAWRALVRGLPRAEWAGLGLITALAAVLRVRPDQWQHNVIDDEYVHLRVAAEFARSFRFAFVVPVPGGAPELTLPPCPPGFHFVLGNVFLLTGYSESVAFFVNACLGVLCVALAFLLARQLFESGWAAHAVALLLAVWPLHVRLSRATSLEIVAHASLLLLAVVLVEARRSPSPALVRLALLIAAWTALTRLELLLAIPLALGLLFADGRVRAACRPPLRLALMLLPLAVPLLHAVYGVAHYNEQRQLVADYPLWSALRYWIDPALFCPLWTVVAAGGAVLLHRGGRPALALLLVSAWIADLLVVAAYRRADPTLADLQRYFVLGGTVPLLLVGHAVVRVRARGRAAAVAALALLVLCGAAPLPQVRQPISPLAAMRRAQERWLREHIGVVPPAALLLSDSADFVWAVTGRSAFPASLLGSAEGRRRLAAPGAPLVLLEESPVPAGLEAMGYVSSTATPGPGSPTLPPCATAALAESELLGRRIGLYRLSCPA
jgi:hypothetical protein